MKKKMNDSPTAKQIESNLVHKKINRDSGGETFVRPLDRYEMETVPRTTPFELRRRVESVFSISIHSNS